LKHATNHTQQRWQQAKNITLKNEPNNKKHNITSDFYVYFLQPKEI
jgi:hypothetical protein